ncbi:MAG: glycosyltransferase family 2 protein [Bacteroidota bacterium]
MIAVVLFWLALATIFYTYVIYPVILFLLVKFKGSQKVVGNVVNWPTVTVVVSVYNEGRVLENKIKNLEMIDYPKEKMTYLFGSDGSNDRTNEILRLCVLPNFRLEIFPERRGKNVVLNELIAQADGEIVVLSDANTFYNADTIKKLVRHFCDRSVGAVCGELVLEPGEATVGGFGEVMYWTYENNLKRFESEFHTTLGATGAVFAIRKELFQPLPIGKAVAPDFVIPMGIVIQGFRVRYESEAVAYEKTSDSVMDEFRRKVRIGARNFYGISEFGSLLHPRHGFVSFALWSRKILRWCVPVLLLVILVTTGLLAATSEFFRGVLLGEVMFLAVALIGFLAEELKLDIGLFGLPYYFVAVNMALVVGFIKFVLGLQSPTWETARNYP